MKAVLSTDEASSLCGLYLSGYSSRKLAKRFNIEKSTVVVYLRKNGIEVRKSIHKPRLEIYSEDILEMYLIGYPIAKLQS